MSDITSSNKTIAKNTAMLYVRMGIMLFVGLYTSRVVLQVLGVTDMGIYSSVGGIVGFVSFLNSALSNGTSRFLVFGLGRGNKDELQSIFSTCFWIHLLLATLLAIIIEPVGLWFLHHKLIIPADRLNAAEWVFHFSVLTMFIHMTQVPYSASIIAHERMDVYAYASLVDAFLKLGIVFLIKTVLYDKLIVYAILLFAASSLLTVFYRFYCHNKFAECRLELKFDKRVFKPIAEYSGWQLFANIAIALSNQGILVLLNMFFSPAIVAARSISLQVEGHAIQFMTNFRTAANPQIIKRYAAGDFSGSKRLLIESTKFSYYLMLLISLPIILLAREVLYIWLGQVPDYSVIFLQLIMIQGLFQVFNTGFYTAINAKGQMKENALSAPAILFAAFPIVYVFFKLGYSPVVLSIAYVISYAIQALIQKPIILVKVVGYKWSDFRDIFLKCFIVTIIGAILPILFRFYIINRLTDSIAIVFLSVGSLSVLSVGLSAWFIGMNKQMRSKFLSMIKRKK